MIKQFAQRSIPAPLRRLRHLWYAWYGAQRYGHPSRDLFVIGVTGTSGKSSVCYFLKQVLERAGYTVGALSTIEFSVAGKSQLNDKKMTMLGKTQIQRFLRGMVDKQCDIAIVETTSEGRLQHRHRWINYDMMVLTNMYPEHIEAHGSFEKYKQAKQDIFAYVAGGARKKRQFGTWKTIPKIAIVNGDSEHAQDFLQYEFEKKYTFGLSNKLDVTATDREVSRDGLRFSHRAEQYIIPLHGEYNFMNVLCVMAISRAIRVADDVIKKTVQQLIPAPGRIEFISEAEKRGFHVIVDYAFEPVAIKALYKVVRLFKPARIIHVFGSTGGGRDVSRRFTVGEYVGKKADICIVTDEDPYDDDPQTIIDDVASAAMNVGKREGETLFKILNRGEAIQKAIEMAQKGDMVLVTGKGSEQAMVIGDRLVPWDDRTCVREALAAKGVGGSL